MARPRQWMRPVRSPHPLVPDGAEKHAIVAACEALIEMS